MMFGGVIFIPNAMLTKSIEDWSGVRSRGRAERRRRQGHPQRIAIRTIADPSFYSFDGGRTYYAHPGTIARLPLPQEDAP